MHTSARSGSIPSVARRDLRIGTGRGHVRGHLTARPLCDSMLAGRLDAHCSTVHTALGVGIELDAVSGTHRSWCLELDSQVLQRFDHPLAHGAIRKASDVSQIRHRACRDNLTLISLKHPTDG